MESVKAQQEARKSDPRGQEDLRSRGFGETRPARELPWLASPEAKIQRFKKASPEAGRSDRFHNRRESESAGMKTRTCFFLQYHHNDDYNFLDN